MLRCEAMAFGLTFEGDEVAVMLTLFEHEGDEEPYAYALIRPEEGVEIAQKFMSNALTGSVIGAELESTPPEDRQDKIREMLERMASGLN